jgi:glycosyltransferase involved in cell wall biosynthesis
LPYRELRTNDTLVISMTNESLSILMVSHHRKSKAFARSHAMARSLVQRGHKVTLLLTSDRSKSAISESMWDGVRTIETPDLLYGKARSGWDIWDIYKRISFLKQDDQKYNLIHCFETRPASIHPVLYYNHNHHLPLIIDWNDWWGRGGLIQVNRPWWWRIIFSRLETYYEEHFRSLAQGTTTISNPLARRAEGLGISKESICVVPGGVNSDLFRPIAREECRRKVGFAAEAKIIAFSSLDSYLDFEVILGLLKLLAEKYIKIQLLITGSVTPKIKSLIKKHALDKHVFYSGLVPYEDLPIYLGCADVFMMPLADTIYNRGRWPNKICEYMAMGIPTVSNPVGDIKNLFENESVGLLCRYTSDAFYSSIDKLFCDADLSKKLGTNARIAVENKYDWNILIQQVENFYFKILGINSNR